MVINIAFGIMLGFVFLFLFCLLIAVVCYVITKLQERERYDDEEEEEVIRPRIRPERSRYEEMQHIKNRAKEKCPDHWRRV